jgi:hypothetical protein
VALNRRCDAIFPGMGVSVRNDSVYYQAGIALSGNAQQSSPIPASGSLAVTTTAGRVRVKIYGGGGTSPTLVDFVVTAGDGTNLITLGQSILHPTVAISLVTASWFEMEFEYVLDVATSGAGGAASGQLSSVVGGANIFAVKTTLGGTSPTASMDLELVPLI